MGTTDLEGFLTNDFSNISRHGIDAGMHIYIKLESTFDQSG
jgi:hypothetical protein